MKTSMEPINGDTWRPGMPKEGWLVRYGLSDRCGWMNQRCFADREEADKFVTSAAKEPEINRHYLRSLDYEIFGRVKHEAANAGFSDVYYDKANQKWYLDKTDTPNWFSAISDLAKRLPQYFPGPLDDSQAPERAVKADLDSEVLDEQCGAVENGPQGKGEAKETPDRGRETGQGFSR